MFDDYETELFAKRYAGREVKGSTWGNGIIVAYLGNALIIEVSAKAAPIQDRHYFLYWNFVYEPSSNPFHWSIENLTSIHLVGSPDDCDTCGAKGEQHCSPFCPNYSTWLSRIITRVKHIITKVIR